MVLTVAVNVRRIRDGCLVRFWNASALAKHSGLSTSTVLNIYRGKRGSIRSIGKIAHALGLDASEIIRKGQSVVKHRRPRTRKK